MKRMWKRDSKRARYYWMGPHPHREVRGRVLEDSTRMVWDVYIETRSGMMMREHTVGLRTLREGRDMAEAFTMADCT